VILVLCYPSPPPHSASLQRIFIIGQYFGNNQSYLEAVNYGRGLAYSPFQSCVVVTHENISCLTVPGVGANLLWQVRAGTPVTPASLRSHSVLE
jgi:hypothetical protein